MNNWLSALIFRVGFMVLLCCGTSWAQQITVLDSETKQPLQGVVVHNLNQKTNATTSKNGTVDLNAFSETESLFFKALAYQTLKTNKTAIVQNDNTVLLVPKVEGLTEIVLSASKFEQTKGDIPQKINSIGLQDIVLSQPQTSADLLQSAGSVYIQKSQMGGGSPMIRGFSTNRLLITVDGVRMNNAIFRSGNLQNVISIDPFSLQKTEVTLGAGSVVYGSDALGGVMGFYTKKPQLSYKDSLYFKANISARYASANTEKTTHADVNFGFKKWAFLSSVSYSDFDDLRMGKHGPDDYLRHHYVETVNGEDQMVENNNPRVQKPTGYSQLNLMQKVRFEPNDNMYFDLGLIYTSTSSYPRYDRLIRYNDDGQLRSAEWDYGPQNWLLTNFQFSKKSSRSNLYDMVNTTVAYQNFKESRHDRNFGSTTRYNTEEKVDAYSINTDFEKRLTPKTELFYGLEYVYNKVHSNGNAQNIDDYSLTPTVSRYPNGSYWQTAAVYGSLKYKPTETLVFQSGLRYNYVWAYADFSENNAFLNLPFDDARINAGALTGNAGVRWLPTEQLQWRLNLSTAFRAPNIDDLGKVFDSSPGAVVVPNNNLKPEYAYGGELGLQVKPAQGITLDLASFYTFLDNALVRRDFSINGETEIVYNGEMSRVQAIQNASKAWIYGFETCLQIDFSKQLKLKSQYSFTKGGEEDETGSEVPIRHVAPAFGNTHLVWQHKQLTLDAYAEYNSELPFDKMAPSEVDKPYLYALDANGNPYAPSWHTFNFRTQYELSDNASVTLALQNITDQRYKTYSSGIASAGRNLVMGLSCGF